MDVGSGNTIFINALSHSDFDSTVIYFQNGIYAVEMVDGRLYVYLDLGAGGTRAEVSSEKAKVNDGQWHEFSIWRNDRDIHCTVDDYSSDFTTNGKI